MAYNHETPQYDERGVFGIKGTSDADDTFNVRGDKTKGTINVGLHTYNTTTMEWEKWSGDTTSTEVEYNDSRVEYNANQDIKYFGEHETSGASEDDPNWQVTYLTYDVNKNILRLQVAEGSWTDREELF